MDAKDTQKKTNNPEKRGTNTLIDSRSNGLPGDESGESRSSRGVLGVLALLRKQNNIQYISVC